MHSKPNAYIFDLKNKDNHKWQKDQHARFQNGNIRMRKQTWYNICNGSNDIAITII